MKKYLCDEHPFDRVKDADSLDRYAEEHGLVLENDWANGTTLLVFGDGSAVCVEGGDVFVETPGEVRARWYFGACDEPERDLCLAGNFGGAEIQGGRVWAWRKDPADGCWLDEDRTLDLIATIERGV